MKSSKWNWIESGISLMIGALINLQLFYVLFVAEWLHSILLISIQLTAFGLIEWSRMNAGKDLCFLYNTWAGVTIFNKSYRLIFILDCTNISKLAAYCYNNFSLKFDWTETEYEIWMNSWIKLNVFSLNSFILQFHSVDFKQTRLKSEIKLW